jgi:CheY-like chemotaxis protein
MGLPTGMGGGMACILLVEDNKTKSVPAIALTAHVLTTAGDRALKAGFDD